MNSSNLSSAYSEWQLPFDSTHLRIIHYTAKNILPGHKYKITVGIELYRFFGSTNETSIEFTSPIMPESRSRQNKSIKIPMSDAPIYWQIVVVVVGITVLLTASGGALWYHNMKKGQRKSLFNTTYIEVKYFTNIYKLIDRDSILNEFYMIEDMDLSTLSKECALKNHIKNRYINIISYDYNRVILPINEYCTSDYINASYIDGYRCKSQYIATQGPKQETVYDFWHMVIEMKCNKIVMLTEIQENNISKCFQYFPVSKTKLKFGNIVIQNVDEHNLGNFIRRTLVIAKGGAYRSLVHYQYVSWPDCDRPQNGIDIIEFIKLTKSTENKSSNPMIVHCSAGVGRTGTFIALDILMRRFRNKKFISVFETVKKLRLQRSNMVQTYSQYQFVYEAINMHCTSRDSKAK